MSEEPVVVDIEDRARGLGWSPKDEFRGDEEKWVDAQTFVDKGESMIPIMKERMNMLERKLAKNEKETAKFYEYHQGVSARAMEKARAEIVEEQARAVEDGDGKKWQELEGKKTELDQQAVQAAQPSAEDRPEMVEFKKNNAWYGVDPEKTALADSLPYSLGPQGFSGKAMLDEVERVVNRTYPGSDEGGNPPPRRPSTPVEGGGRPPKAKGNKKSYSDLPADAKQACDEFVRRSPKGADGKPIFTQAQYVKEYDWS